MELIGELVLDRYRIVEVVATGGYSIVYRGIDERLERPVCIKVFSRLSKGGPALRTAYEHFVQEAFAMSSLTHPNTLRIYDFGHLDGEETPVQVSEFVNAGHLGELVRRDGRFTLAETLRFQSLLADALAEAHSQQLVHRDIKPSNILVATVAGSYEPKLADFGIAKSLVGASVANRTDTNVTAGRTLMFSARWAAPEQLVGLDVNPATDVYSLALLVVYMLSGRTVFSAQTCEEALEERRDSALRIGQALDGVDLPGGAIEILRRACAFQPERRPAKVEQLTRDLRRASAGIRFELPVGHSVPQARVPSETARLHQVSSPSSRSVFLRPGAHERVGERSCEVVALDGESTTLRVGDHRLQVTLVPSDSSSRVVHIRGLTSFVAKEGLRPSSAVQLSVDGDVELVDPRNHRIDRVHLRFGRESGDETVFRLPDRQTVSVSRQECPRAILLDCPDQAQSYFVHAPTQAAEARGKTKHK